MKVKNSRDVLCKYLDGEQQQRDCDILKEQRLLWLWKRFHEWTAYLYFSWFIVYLGGICINLSKRAVLTGDRRLMQGELWQMEFEIFFFNFAILY